jgi:DNA-binding CsgD family transcriptional regulator
MEPEALLALTEQIYDAAAGIIGWTVVGQSLSALLQAQGAFLMLAEADRVELLFHINIPAEACCSRDPAAPPWPGQAGAAEPDGPARIWSSAGPVPEASRSAVHDRPGRDSGLGPALGVALPLGSGVLRIGLHRPEGAVPFAEAEAALLRAALPHLHRALRLRQRLAAGEAAATQGRAALDALAMPVLVVDPDLALLAANLAAESLLAAGGVLRLVRRPGLHGLLAGQREDMAPLRAIVRATALSGGPGGAVRLHDARGRAALAALVAPLPQRIAQAPRPVGRIAGCALLRLRPFAAPPPGPGLLRDLFGLSQAEAEIAIAMSAATSKAAVAAARGLRETTVRTQVRAVLEKTGTANLRELAALLAGLQGLAGLDYPAGAAPL